MHIGGGPQPQVCASCCYREPTHCCLQVVKSQNPPYYNPMCAPSGSQASQEIEAANEEKESDQGQGVNSGIEDCAERLECNR